jgi:pSer/pThr/pTyr-binding forkhead associated (FHA) protein
MVVGRCPVLRVAADGRELVVGTPVQVTVGRDAGADLSVAHPRVSRRHLVLRPDSQGWVLEDAGSTNGTFHEGRRVSVLRIDGPVRLRLGDPDDGAELRVEPDPGDRAERWRLATTVAISVLTVLGAGLAFWAATLGTRAVDGDRRAVLETVRVQQQRVATDTRVRAEASLAAAWRATLAEIDVLEREAAQARRAGRLDEAAELADRARVQRSVARGLTLAFPTGALKGGEGAEASFDLDARRRALAGLTLEAQEVAQLDPDQTAGQARQVRRRSVLLQAWSVVLVVVLALLTFARLSEPVRPWLAATGMVLVVAVAAGAFLTVTS